jgi:hypothetical protein
MKKLPKLFARDIPLGVVRSNRNEYELEDGYFTPITHDDFYFFIRQGFLLADDPNVKEEAKKIAFGMGDEDVLKAMRANKGVKEEIALDENFKNVAYKEYFDSLDEQVKKGEIAGYPEDVLERAEAYFKERFAEVSAKSKLLSADDEDATVEPISSTDENGDKTEELNEDEKPLSDEEIAKLNEAELKKELFMEEKNNKDIEVTSETSVSSK